MTDLIIWRHAEAAECNDPLLDHQRKLTARGEKQAARVADDTAFFLLGDLIECGKTGKIFTVPDDQRTNDYVTGRFG